MVSTPRTPGRRSRAAAVALSAVLVATAPAATASASAAAGSEPAGARLAATLRADLQTYLADQGSAEHVSAVALTVTFAPHHPGGDRPVSLAAGTTARGGRTAVRPDARWQIGSNTKAYASVLLLRLEARGALSIGDRVGDWLPQYPAWKDITIRQLLSMTSGIPDYLEDPAFLADIQADPGRGFTGSQLIAYVSGQPLGRPGYAYSNTNYILAQEIIERAGRDSFAHQLTAQILDPLGLRDTCYADACPPRTAARMPTGYYAGPDAGPGVAVPPLALTGMRAAGGIVASLPDLARWERALYSGALLPPRQQRELESLVSTATGRPIRTTTPADPHGYGLGLGQVTSPLTGTVWIYNGETFGFRVLHLYDPRSGLLIALAVNSGGVADDHLPELLGRVYRDLAAAGLDGPTSAEYV